MVLDLAMETQQTFRFEDMRWLAPCRRDLSSRKPKDVRRARARCGSEGRHPLGGGIDPQSRGKVIGIRGHGKLGERG